MNAKAAKRIRKTITNWRDRRYTRDNTTGVVELAPVCGRYTYQMAKRIFG